VKPRLPAPMKTTFAMEEVSLNGDSGTFTSACVILIALRPGESRENRRPLSRLPFASASYPSSFDIQCSIFDIHSSQFPCQ
jgi:hypothetical protein